MSLCVWVSARFNDKELGPTPVARVDRLPIGRHRVRVNKDGFLPFASDVVVQRNETTLLQVNLVDEASLEPWYYKWWVWTAAGAVVLTGVSLAIVLQPEPVTTVEVEAPLPF